MTDVSRETGPGNRPWEDLHGGWPFGLGPDKWPWFLRMHGATEIQPEGIHVSCGECGQSITRAGNWRLCWESLKPQIAAHVMQVHPEHVTG